MSRPKPKVLLIGWDAADWDHITPLLDAGQLPTLEGLINGGVMGNLATLQPVLSPMLWNSIATGKHAYKHGIHGFIEPDRTNGGARPFSSTSRTARALWNILHYEGYRCNVVNWWASHPAEQISGCVVSDLNSGIRFDAQTRKFVAAKGTIHPEEKAPFYAQFKVLPNELTYQHLAPFVPDFGKLDQENDSRLASLATVIAETGTTHAIATAVMELEPWDFMAVYYTGIDHFSHAFMQYHPPRMPYVSEEDFEMFRQVIEGAYRFHDMMLERLLQLAGPDVTVILCSDHGFQSREGRPMGMPREPAGPAIWHRRFGIFVANGPGIRRDERVYGGSLIDIAPTILTIFGLPVGQDMDGRPLIEIFEHETTISSIPSWEEVDGDFAESKNQKDDMSVDESQELLQQFVALGYIDDPGSDKDEQFESAEIEAKYNLARNYYWLGKYEDARGLAEEIVHRRPWETRFIIFLANVYFAAGFIKQTQKLLTAAFDLTKTRQPSVLILWGQIEIKLGNRAAGIAILKLLGDSDHVPKETYCTVGKVLLQHRLFSEAEKYFLKAIQDNPDDAEAHLGLSTIYLRSGRNQESADESLAAVGLIFRLPVAHYNLGLALARSGDYDRAAAALNTAIRFAPKMIRAHRLLAAIYRSKLDNTRQATFHRNQALNLSLLSASETIYQRDLQDCFFDLPEFASEIDRERTLREKRPDQPDPRRFSGKTFTLVSGLPRSGTSLMMQMLAAGGLSPKTDGERTADENNPRGYFEWEAIKQIAKNPKILDAEGLERQAIKVISMLIPQLPIRHAYKIIFMTRPAEEVALSQAQMIARLETQGSRFDTNQTAIQLAAHRSRIVAYMQSFSRMQFLEVDYPSLIASPTESIARIAEFLGPEALPHPERMAEVIDESLYRIRERITTK